MEWWEAALLGLVQGLTEFLPVSSSGHLVLGKYLLGLDTAAANQVTFEVFVHFGTVLSILTVYRERVGRILYAVFRQPAQLVAVGAPSGGGAHADGGLKARYQNDGEFQLAVYILITLVPTGIAYVLFKDPLEAAFQNPRLVCAMLLVTGTLLLLTLLRKNPDGPLSPLKALLIGVAQSAALIPGISRSGSTICTALYQNVSPEKAADFSFLMLLPVVVGATILKSVEMFEQGMGVEMGALLIGTLVAYVSGVVAIKAMIGFVVRGALHYFAFYCYLIGTLGLVFI